MFYGKFQHTIDPKGRVIIPAAFRDGNRLKFMIAKGLEECLFIFSMEQWDDIYTKLKALPFSDAKARDITRFFFSSACECELDGNSRILVPPELRTYAGLEKEIVIIGVGSRAEVWSKAKWETYMQKDTFTPDNIAEAMAQLGI